MLTLIVIVGAWFFSTSVAIYLNVISCAIHLIKIDFILCSMYGGKKIVLVPLDIYL